MLFNKLSDDAIPLTNDRFLVTERIEFVVKPATEVKPEEIVSVLLKAKDGEPNASADTMDVAPMLCVEACALKSPALIS